MVTHNGELKWFVAVIIVTYTTWTKTLGTHTLQLELLRVTHAMKLLVQSFCVGVNANGPLQLVSQQSIGDFYRLCTSAPKEEQWHPSYSTTLEFRELLRTTRVLTNALKANCMYVRTYAWMCDNPLKFKLSIWIGRSVWWLVVGKLVWVFQHLYGVRDAENANPSWQEGDSN